MNGLHFLATGRCLPASVLTNDDLSQMVDTSDEWITTRTGIKQRYICRGERHIDLAEGAARTAMERAGIRPEELGAVVVATFSPEFSSPTTACLLQSRLGLPEGIPMLDLNGACAGFLYALQVARGLLMQSDKRCALVLGCEVITPLLDFTDRTTCVLFGDGAAAAVVELDPERLYVSDFGSRSSETMIQVPGAAYPGRSSVHMDGRAVFRFAVEIIPQCMDRMLQKAGLAQEQIDWFVFHQANHRILEHVIRKRGLDPDKVYQNMARYGNTSAASIPLALDEMNEQGLFQPGQRVLSVGFGAGLTWGGALWTW